MAKQLTIYIFSFLTLICNGQKTNSVKAKDFLDTTTIQLKVKLADDLNKITLPPHCGIFEVNSLTLKYDVTKVIQGNYKAKTILINHRCPRELVEKKLIENEKTYTLKLRPKIIRSTNKADQDNVEYEIIE